MKAINYRFIWIPKNVLLLMAVKLALPANSFN